MNKKWTKDQLDAIKGRDSQMLVAAAAGAGKTAVLVERIIRRITDPNDPVDVDRLLVVTFTAAAAAEMRERIGLAITKLLETNPDSSILQRQLALLQSANISTIHSFCLEIIRQHFYRLDLDPVFRVADEAEATLLQLDVLEDILERRFVKGDKNFLLLADCYGGRKDDSGLMELVLELFKFSRSTPRPSAWLSNLESIFLFPDDIKVEDLPWFNILKNSVVNELNGVRSMLEQALQLTGRPGGPAPYRDALEDDLALLDELFDACAAGWDNLYQRFCTMSFAQLKKCKKGESDEELKKMVQKIRTAIKERLQKLSQRYFNRDSAQLLEDLKFMIPLVGMLAELVQEFADGYRQVKLERGVVDFSDLEHYALQVLHESLDNPDLEDLVQPSPVALELRNRFAEVLVDEYQDINAVQETIINLVASGKGTTPGLFMVGDVKQSIYRFRLAEPGLFMEKYKRFSLAAPDTGKLINLARNFRSRKTIVDAVNFIFRQVMSSTVGEMTYDSKAELVCGAIYPTVQGITEEPVELHLIETVSDGADHGSFEDYESEAAPVEELDALQVEARTVAQRIIQLMEDGYLVFDREREEYRPITYRDVVVLLRATTGRANTFVEEFSKLGIPAYADLNTGYFEAVEVETIISLLKIIDNPRQDVPLAAVLRSPLAGFNSEDLAQIRLCGSRGDFYDAVVMATLDGPDELAGRLTEFLRLMERWRTRARRGSLAELIWTLYRDTGYYDFVGGLPGGSQRQANLRALYSRAEQYESTVYRGLFRFLRFIERIRDNNGDMGTARTLGENENLVRIMSIHKSKGLEFPVVFVSGLGKRFNLMDLNKGMLMHRELGLGPQLVDSERRVSYPTIAKLAIKEKLKAESLAEEMRVLYVAMTRAREKLILVGSVRKLQECSTRWCSFVGLREQHLPTWMTSGAVHCLDWLAPAVARHRDGDVLREMAGVTDRSLDVISSDESIWRVYIWDNSLCQLNKPELTISENMQRVRRLDLVSVKSSLTDLVHNYLGWSYSYKYLQGVTARETVTGLKRLTEMITDESAPLRDYSRGGLTSRPMFMQKHGQLTAAERGQVLHLTMQFLDLDGRLDKDGIVEQLAAMVKREQLSEEQAAAVNPDAVACFFSSTLGKRLLGCKQVYRELPFTLAMPAHLVYPSIEKIENSGEKVLVQGIIDCLADEGDGLLLIDYKTDRYSWDTLTTVTQRYKDQLNLYTQAVEKLTGHRVKGRYLYMFHHGDIVSLPRKKQF